MECKFICINNNIIFRFRINRNIVECKLAGKYTKKEFEAWLELIETLWNVNSAEDEKEKNDNPELIETLWNVNLYSPPLRC